MCVLSVRCRQHALQNSFFIIFGQLLKDNRYIHTSLNFSSLLMRSEYLSLNAMLFPFIPCTMTINYKSAPIIISSIHKKNNEKDRNSNEYEWKIHYDTVKKIDQSTENATSVLKLVDWCCLLLLIVAAYKRKFLFFFSFFFFLYFFNVISLSPLPLSAATRKRKKKCNGKWNIDLLQCYWHLYRKIDIDNRSKTVNRNWYAHLAL